MVERGEQIGFALEILDDRLAHQGIRHGIDHFLDRYELGDVGEVHVAGAVDRTHPTNTNHFLNCIAVGKCQSRLKLTWRGRALITLIIR